MVTYQVTKIIKLVSILNVCASKYEFLMGFIARWSLEYWLVAFRSSHTTKMGIFVIVVKTEVRSNSRY